MIIVKWLLRQLSLHMVIIINITKTNNVERKGLKEERVNKVNKVERKAINKVERKGVNNVEKGVNNVER